MEMELALSRDQGYVTIVTFSGGHAVTDTVVTQSQIRWSRSHGYGGHAVTDTVVTQSRIRWSH
jgi:hypothetical protein